jgi:hypothetical protein
LYSRDFQSPGIWQLKQGGLGEVCRSFQSPDIYRLKGAWRLETAALQQNPQDKGFKKFKSPRRRMKVCCSEFPIAGYLSLKFGGAWRDFQSPDIYRLKLGWLAVGNRSYTDETRLRGFQEVQKSALGEALPVG